MSDRREHLNRRAALKVIASMPFAALLPWGLPEIDKAQQRASAALLEALETGVAYEPKFFTAHEWQAVRVLADLIIPRDERSGSATDVGVPEFIDFMMLDQPDSQEPMRTGLSWLDDECQRRFAANFIASDEAQRASLLDELAWPARAPAALAEGVRFFVSFRNLTLTGFWTSKAGIEDLQYKGNAFLTEWNGCPPEALRKLGVSY